MHKGEGASPPRFKLHIRYTCVLLYIRRRARIVVAQFLPLAVLVHAGVALHAVLLDEELDALMEGRGYGGRLLAQQHLHRVLASYAHQVLAAHCLRAALAVRAVLRPVCENKVFYLFLFFSLRFKLRAFQ